MKMTMLAAAAAVVLAVLPSESQPERDIPVTLTETAQHRSSAVSALSGRVLFDYTVSQRQREAYWHLHAASAERAKHKYGMSKAEIPKLADQHALVVDFTWDIYGDLWRREAVDLTNSGMQWLPYNAIPAAERDVPAGQFYVLSVHDGTGVYVYDRRSNSAAKMQYRARGRPDRLDLVRSKVITTIDGMILREARNGRLHGRLLGEQTIDGRDCLAVGLVEQDAMQDGVATCARVWLAVGLAHAAVRQEIATFDCGRLVSLRIIRAREFIELVPGLWCPRVVQADTFWYIPTGSETETSVGGARDAYSGQESWWDTAVLTWRAPDRTDSVLFLEADYTPPTIEYPRFPFDATVRSEDVPGGSQHLVFGNDSAYERILKERQAPMPPDELGSTIDSATAYQLFTRDSL